MTSKIIIIIIDIDLMLSFLLFITLYDGILHVFLYLTNVIVNHNFDFTYINSNLNYNTVTNDTLIIKLHKIKIIFLY